MNFKIIAGKKLIEKYYNSSDLKVLHKTPNLVIQGGSKVKKLYNKKSNQIFFLGHLIGKKNTNDELELLNLEKKSSQLYLLDQPIEKSIKELEGRFILLKVKSDDTFEIACDIFNQIDLYYQFIDNGIILATNLDLLPFKNTSIKYDQAALIHTSYIYGFRPPKKHTLYEGVKRLGVGEIIIWKNTKFKIYKIEPYIFNTKKYNQKDLIRYSHILLDAIEKRSSPNGNIVYLSSGWDSTAIIACLVKLYSSKKVRAVIGRMNFSERYGVCNPFEIKKAEAIANYFNIKLEIVEFDYWRRGPEITEKHKKLMKSQMMTGMAFYQWIDLANYVAKTYNGESVFSGEISDGVHNFGFSQNATILEHPVFDFREYSDKMINYIYGPTFLKSIWNKNYKDDFVFKVLKDRLGNNIFEKSESNNVNINLQLLASSFISDVRFPFWSLKNNKALTNKGREIYVDTFRKEYLSEAAEEITLKNLYSWYTHLYNSFHWQGGTVASLDITSNEYGFDIQLPFRDSRLIKFLNEMPESWGRGLELKPTKYPLKWMLENCIDYPMELQTGPHSYLYDINPSFDHAAEWIYHSAFNQQYSDIIKKREYLDIMSEDIFDLNYYDSMIKKYLNKEEVSNLDWGSNLANLIFLSAMGWYK